MRISLLAENLSSLLHIALIESGNHVNIVSVFIVSLDTSIGDVGLLRKVFLFSFLIIFRDNPFLIIGQAKQLCFLLWGQILECLCSALNFISEKR